MLQARKIATEMHIPYKVLTQILAELVAAELLEARHGPAGGYRLARPPAGISLLDVVEAAEGPVTFDHCVLRDGPHDWDETCPVHDTWTEAQNALSKELSTTTLADLARIDSSIQAGTHQSHFGPIPIPPNDAASAI